MRKTVIIIFAIVTVLCGLLRSPVSIFAQQQLVVDQDKVVYNLPYPGILPDNPLYFFKIVRDRLTEFGTRDMLKKAELYLLYSDKRLVMAKNLSGRGKDGLAVSTLSKSEKYFEKIPDLLVASKNEGVSPSSDLINRLKMSNVKHAEIEAQMLKDLSQGAERDMRSIIQLNQKIKKQLQKF